MMAESAPSPKEKSNSHGQTAREKCEDKIISTSQEKKLPRNRAYTVDDIVVILGIAKSTAYQLVNSGEFKTNLHRLRNPHF